MNHSITSVDLSNFKNASATIQEDFSRTIGDSLSITGFIAVEGHGLDLDRIQNTYQLAQEIFTLPLSEKTKHVKSTMTGMPRGFAVFSPEADPSEFLAEYKEAWHFGPDISEKYPVQNLLNATNSWPLKDEAGKELLSNLYSSMHETALTILDACSLYIGKPVHYFREMAQGDSLFRMLKYPAIPESYRGPRVRTKAHEDLGMLTVMCEPTADGLEFLGPDGTWNRISDLKGKFLINVGEMLADMTNDLFHSPIHRVVGPDQRNENRFSLIAFIMAKNETFMGHLHHSKKIHSLSVKEYLALKIPQLPSY